MIFDSTVEVMIPSDEPEKPIHSFKRKRTLGVFSVRRISVWCNILFNIVECTGMQIILLVYFNVSGGPLGSETIFSACGPLVGLIALFTFPLVSNELENILWRSLSATCLIAFLFA